jgi:hypothetical protein
MRAPRARKTARRDFDDRERTNCGIGTHTDQATSPLCSQVHPALRLYIMHRQYCSIPLFIGAQRVTQRCRHGLHGISGPDRVGLASPGHGSTNPARPTAAAAASLSRNLIADRCRDVQRSYLGKTPRNRSPAQISSAECRRTRTACLPETAWRPLDRQLHPAHRTIEPSGASLTAWLTPGEASLCSGQRSVVYNERRSSYYTFGGSSAGVAPRADRFKLPSSPRDRGQLRKGETAQKRPLQGLRHSPAG